MVSLYIPLTVVFFACWATALGLFLSRRHLEPIRSREWGLSVCSAVGGIIYWVLAALSEIAWDGIPVPCHERIWVSYFLIPAWLTVRSLDFVVRFSFNFSFGAAHSRPL